MGRRRGPDAARRRVQERRLVPRAGRSGTDDEGVQWTGSRGARGVVFVCTSSLVASREDTVGGVGGVSCLVLSTTYGETGDARRGLRPPAPVHTSFTGPAKYAIHTNQT